MRLLVIAFFLLSCIHAEGQELNVLIADAPKVSAGPQARDYFRPYCPSCRPKWPVAGVDYPVGIDDGPPLKDPTLPSSYPGGAFPPGVNYNPAERFIRANGPDNVFERMDFCRGGGSNAVGLYWKGSRKLTVINSSFCGGDGLFMPITSDIGTGEVILAKFAYDGNGSEHPLFRHQGCNATVLYGDMKNAGADFFNPIGDCAANNWLIARNLFRDGGAGSKTAHPDWIQAYSPKATYESFRVLENTALQERKTVGTQGWLGASFATRWKSAEVSRNIAVTSGMLAASFIVFPLNGVVDRYEIADNYADTSGAYGFYYGGRTKMCVPPTICRNNINLRTGREIEP